MGHQEIFQTLESQSVLGDEVELYQEDLSNALLLRDTLEHEIHDLVQAISEGPSGAFSVLPTELLVEVIQHVILENTMDIRPLLLVCQTWNRILRSTPHLWSTIRIIVPLQIKQLAQCTSYCTMCGKYSANRPLDITIDYQVLESWNRSRGQSVGYTLKEIPMEKIPRDGGYYCWDALHSLRRGGRNDVHYNYQGRYLAPLQALIGKDHSVMNRWKSFELLGGALYHRTSIHQAALSRGLFVGDTPILESLRLTYFSSWNSSSAIGGSPTSSNKPIAWNLPRCPKLKELLVTQLCGPLSVRGINPLQLRQLRISCFDRKHFQFVLNCQNVTTLHLGNPLHGGFEETRHARSLLFSRLTRLELGMIIPSWFFELLDAPLLTTVSFVYAGAFFGVRAMTFPLSVNTVEFRWPHIRLRSKMFVEALACIERSPSVTTILCASMDEEDVRRGLRAGRGSMTPLKLYLLPSHLAEVSEVIEVVDLT